jgi:hypothetical protein
MDWIGLAKVVLRNYGVLHHCVFCFFTSSLHKSSPSVDSSKKKKKKRTHTDTKQTKGMASTNEVDKESKSAISKDAINLFDDTDDLLDYGDAYDLDIDIPNTDLVDVENYDEYDLDDLAIDAPLANTQAKDSSSKSVDDSDHKSGGPTSSDGVVKGDKSLVKGTTASAPSSTIAENARIQDNVSGEQSLQSQYNQGQRDNANGGYNQQVGNGRPAFSNMSARGGAGGAGRGGMRGRGQNYMGMGMGMGMGRGNFQGRPGMGHHNMMNMNMGGMGQNTPIMPMQMMGGMGMNMGMGIGGQRFPG